MNQRGFATLEVILMVMVIGILASIAVPRFGNITAEANTAKIQADLSTIDTAIAVAIMSGETTITAGKKVSETDALKDYLQDYKTIKPPTGKCYIGGKDPEPVPKGDYTIAAASDTDTTLRAKLDTHTAGDFFKGKSTT